MCISIYASNTAIEFPFLLQQVWFGKLVTSSNTLTITEVYDICLRNPLGGQPLKRVQLLHIPCSQTTVLSKHISVQNIFPDNSSDRQYGWYFGKPPQLKRNEAGLCEVCLTWPGHYSSHECFCGKLLKPEVYSPQWLTTEKAQILMSVRCNVHSIDFGMDSLYPGEQGCFRLLFNYQVQKTDSLDHVDSMQNCMNSQWIKIYSPTLINEKIFTSLADPGIDLETNHRSAKIFNNMINDGFQNPVRIEDHRIALILERGIDVTIVQEASGIKPFGSLENVPLGHTSHFWCGGAALNQDKDLVYRTREIFNLIRSRGQVTREEIIRDVAPTGKHEAISVLLDLLFNLGAVHINNANILYLPETAKEDTPQEYLLTKLRQHYQNFKKNYKLHSSDKPPQFLFDQHPFRIQFSVRGTVAIVEAYISESLSQDEIACLYLHLGEMKQQGVGENVFLVGQRIEGNSTVLSFQSYSYEEIYKVLRDLLAPFRMAQAVDWEQSLRSCSNISEDCVSAFSGQSDTLTQVWKFAERMADVFESFQCARIYRIKEVSGGAGIAINLFTDEDIAARLARIQIVDTNLLVLKISPDSKTSTIAIGKEINMRDKYVAGQTINMGPNANFHDVSIQQMSLEGIDQHRLVSEFASLRKAMRDVATDASHDLAVGEVAAAETAVKAGDAKSMWRHLGQAGKWAFDVATDIGTQLAAEVLKKSMGM